MPLLFSFFYPSFCLWVFIIHKMNMSVVVEGIESGEQNEVMKNMEVEYIQGFFYSKPIPEEEFVEFIIQNNKKD